MIHISNDKALLRHTQKYANTANPTFKHVARNNNQHKIRRPRTRVSEKLWGQRLKQSKTEQRHKVKQVNKSFEYGQVHLLQAINT